MEIIHKVMRYLYKVIITQNVVTDKLIILVLYIIIGNVNLSYLIYYILLT